MPVQFSNDAVIEKNDTAIDACDESIDRLTELGEEGLFPDDESERLIQLSRAVNQKTNLRQINANLTAAKTVVRPMPDNIANELNELGNRLDQQIRDDLIANATIDFIRSVLTDVGRLRSITDAHQVATH
jgi:hypothetical protein